MKKIYNILIASLLSLLLVTACDDNVDDVAELTGSLEISETVVDDETLELLLNGMYEEMNDEGSFGKYIFVIGDLVSDNAFVSLDNTNRFTTTDDYSWSATSGDYISVWEQLYDVVAQANLVIEYSETIEVTDQDFVDDLVGQAYVGRAYAFYYLATFFAQNPLSGIETDKGIILPETYNSNNNLTRSTVAESWTQIESDLLTGLSFLDGDGENTKLGETAAYILLSRVCLFTGDYTDAITYADDALASSSYSLVSSTDYVDSWIDEASSESVFQLSYSSGDNLTLNGLAAIYDDQGYGDVIFRENLYTSFPADDVRKNLLTITDRTIDDPMGYWTTKFPYEAGELSVGELDIRLIRMSEAWLNKIEAYYHSGNESSALSELNSFVATRHSSTYSSSGNALLEDILFERQLEFYGEGMRFMDLKRNEMDIEEGTNYISVSGLTYPDDYYVFPIPQDEIDDNPSLSDEDQNPGY
jgi:hypothetical protein